MGREKEGMSSKFQLVTKLGNEWNTVYPCNEIYVRYIRELFNIQIKHMKDLITQ